MTCVTETALKCILFVTLVFFIIQVYTLEEKFNPWNKYGTATVLHEKASNGTGTTRLEYDYVSKPFPYKNRPVTNKNFKKPISPITVRQIALRKHYLNRGNGLNYV